ncbi:YihY/virulence factor BrkB family protein [Flavobacterium solisilvae]|uniref:YihY/virulence factor BrkB family protein n=1 Tax=Flavobacterium solisilvae TaxID=1852019 RepID=A0ABX1QZ55_9FLAO|nr:YihY/virulence factor BrkB family protein [Flavobacterium solisilvae]NMH26325.1 YihY/virulence factor BrkB family protein [Flavobacterium solisilvae]
MSSPIENKLMKLPVIKQVIILLQKIKLPWLYGLSLYDLLDIYFIGIIEGAISYRAAAIAWSFFMALFPFMLFIFNLIPYIPIEGFQEDFLSFVQQNVPPTTYDAIYSIISDILNNSNTGLISTGFFMAIILMTNGVNAILGGFENSHHIDFSLKRKFFRQYFVSLALSLLLSLILIITVAAIVILEVIIQKTIIQDVLSDKISLLETGRYIFVILMILFSTSLLFKFGVKREKNRAFISIGSVFTTILIILSSYFFGIWVVKFSKYNELYGSIGTLLVVMFYVWINCMILLLGFDLNASINKLKREREREEQKEVETNP